MFITFHLLLIVFRRFQGFVKLLHGLGFVGCGNVYVGFHGLVVAVAGPPHHHDRRDADGQGVADEGFPGGVGAHQFPFGKDFFYTVAVHVLAFADGLVDAAKLAEILEGRVHLLVGDDGEGFIGLKLTILVFVQDGTGVAVEIDGNGVVRFLRHYVDILLVDIASA